MFPLTSRVCTSKRSAKYFELISSHLIIQPQVTGLVASAFQRASDDIVCASDVTGISDTLASVELLITLSAKSVVRCSHHMWYMVHPHSSQLTSPDPTKETLLSSNPSLTLAARRAQDNSVLVLEAGSPKFNDRNIKMPIGILRYPVSSFFSSEKNRKYAQLPVHLQYIAWVFRCLMILFRFYTHSGILSYVFAGASLPDFSARRLTGVFNPRMRNLSHRKASTSVAVR